MSNSPEIFTETFAHIQQQFKRWNYLEQLHACIELSRTLQLSYRYFLSQILQTNVQNETNDMFNHTVDDANAPEIVKCLLSSSLNKVLSTLQLYLPLISTKTIKDELFDAYRNVLIYLDSNLSNPAAFSCSQQHIINSCEYILFFIQINANLNNLSLHIPRLIKLIQANQQYHAPLQSCNSTRHQIQPLMNCLSDTSYDLLTFQQLTRHGTDDSGIDLSETSRTSSIQNILSGHNSQNHFLDRSHLNNATILQKTHSVVSKTTSSPIPEHAATNGPVRIPLKGVVSAPPDTKTYFNPSKHRPVLSKSDEDEQESPLNVDQTPTDAMYSAISTRPLGHFCSFRDRTMKINRNLDGLLQYLGVDTTSALTQNTFSQINSGMKDVPKWLKHLRLHKYELVFSQMTYDDMMNITQEKLKQYLVTDGACSKILLNIRKLKERSILLKRILVDIENGQCDIQNILQQLNEIMLTPILSKQMAQENRSDEDLPALILDILNKITLQISGHSSLETFNQLMELINKCYKHDAFLVERNSLLQLRGTLTKVFQTLGTSDHKSVQLTHSYSHSGRRITKSHQNKMKGFNGNHYSTSSIPIDRFSSEPVNQFSTPINNNLNEFNSFQRVNKSPINISSTFEDSNEYNLQTSTPTKNNGAYLASNQHQTLVRKASIGPNVESNTFQRVKLCKTYSDPNRMRFPTSIQSSFQQQNLSRVIGTSYSQQRHFNSRLSPTSNVDVASSNSSPNKKSYSDNENTDYYENNCNNHKRCSLSPTNNINEMDDQRNANTEFESLCRQITESAISEDSSETLDVLNIEQSSQMLTDTKN